MKLQAGAVGASLARLGLAWVLGGAWLCSSSCRQGAGSLDDHERGLPLMQRAQERAALGDTAGAAQLYEQALAQDPLAARGHLDLGILLHDFEKDFAGAVYHYGRYLRLRPDTEKKQMIEDRMRLAKQALAATILPEDRNAARKIRELEEENRVLRAKTAELEARTRSVVEHAGQSEEAKVSVEPPVQTAPAAPGLPGPAERDAGQRTYVVRQGDTLSSIAALMYGDAGKWKRIHEANRGVLGDSDRVKVGQELVVP